MEKEKLGGVVFPLVTPFCGEDEHVNYPTLDKLIDFLIENGATGVIPCGSTGELVSMTLEEQLEINRHTIEYVNHRCKVYACKIFIFSVCSRIVFFSHPWNTYFLIRVNFCFSFAVFICFY